MIEPAVGRVAIGVTQFARGPSCAIGRAVRLPGHGVLIDAVRLDRGAVVLTDRRRGHALSKAVLPALGLDTLVVSGAPLLADHAGVPESVEDTGADRLVVIGRVISGSVVVKGTLDARLAVSTVVSTSRAVPGAVALGPLLNLFTPVAGATDAVRRCGAGLADRRRSVSLGNAPGLGDQAGGLDEGVAIEALRTLRLTRAVGELITGLGVDSHVEAVAAPGAGLVRVLLGDEADAGAQLAIEALSIGLTVARARALDAVLGIFTHAHEALAVRVCSTRLSEGRPIGVGYADAVDDLAGD